MKILAGGLLCGLLYGCAAQANYTANSTVRHEEAFKECVAAEARKVDSLSGTSTDRANQAVARCQGHLVIINDKLREENRWKHYYGSFADDYTASLKERTVAAVMSELANKQSR